MRKPTSYAAVLLLSLPLAGWASAATTNTPPTAAGPRIQVSSSRTTNVDVAVSGAGHRTLLVVELDGHGPVSSSLYEFDSGPSVERNGQPLACPQCTDSHGTVTLPLPAGHRLVLGSDGHLTATSRQGRVLRLDAGYFNASRGTAVSATPGGSSGAGTVGLSAGTVSLSLPALRPASVVYAALPCEFAGTGTGTLSGATSVQLSCDSLVNDFEQTKRPSTWRLTTNVRGVGAGSTTLLGMALS